MVTTESPATDRRRSRGLALLNRARHNVPGYLLEGLQLRGPNYKDLRSGVGIADVCVLQGFLLSEIL